MDVFVAILGDWRIVATKCVQIPAFATEWTIDPTGVMVKLGALKMKPFTKPFTMQREFEGYIPTWWNNTVNPT